MAWIGSPVRELHPRVLRRRRGVRRGLTVVAILTILATAFVPAASAQTGNPDLDQVVAELEAADTGVWIEPDALTAGDPQTIIDAVQRARDRGIDAHVAVLSEQRSNVQASEIMDATGGTVMLYMPSTYDFVSVDICDEVFSEAFGRADDSITGGLADEGVRAFLDEVIALDPSTCEEPSEGRSILSWLGLILGICLLCGLVWLVARVVGGRRRARRAQTEFQERRRILREWAETLRQPITELQVPVAAAKSSSLAKMYNDALKVARESEADLDRAQGAPDLDRVEIRIARAQMQIRDVRKRLDLG